MYDALIDQIREALGRHGGVMNASAAQQLIAGLHPSDLAFILDELTLPEAECLFATLDDDRTAQTLEHERADRCIATFRSRPVEVESGWMCTSTVPIR